MKSYPSITKDVIHVPIYAFDKLDGSNIRAEWNRKRGFYKFGSRTQLLSTDQPFINEANELIKSKYEKDLSDIFKKEGYQSVVAFFEFGGKNSFAGVHKEETHTVTLFDIAPHKKGILYPKDYLKLVGHLDIAKLLYRGLPDQNFKETVKDGLLGGMTFEGVVCKAPNNRTPEPIMFKIKNKYWVGKLREYCKGDEKLFRFLY